MRIYLSFALILSLTACGEGEPLLPPDAVLPDGGRYRGQVVDGLLQGPGRLDYANGSWFEGQFKDGQPEGQGIWQSANAGTRYQGEFHQGLFHGQGRIEYTGGAFYQGGFKLGQRHGEGHLQQSGQTYRGGFRRDQFHGLGKLEWSDGRSYQGRFVRDIPDGEGVRTDAEGNVLSGTFKAGLLNGQGSLQTEDGDHYSGGFRDDQFHGQGRYQQDDGGVWSGVFKHGDLTGKGEFTGEDGEHYQGDFRYWRYAGEGDLRLADGSRYQGHFDRGEYSGEGTLTLADGTQQKGLWAQGRLLTDSAGNLQSDPLELGLLEQGRLLREALAAVPPSTPKVELYSLTLAGYGEQSVFLREADYVNNLLDKRFAARGQINLVNHRDHMADRPLATRENLARALQTLGERSGPEDVLFIYLTSHGSRQHELSIEQPGLELDDLPVSTLKQLLRPVQDRYKVLVVSACYSGGLIAPLKDEKTLIMTASRADRVSFGCSEEADFTYFGRALFAEALQQTGDLVEAFGLAQTAVAAREQSEDFAASEPQLWAAPAVLAQWRKLPAPRANSELVDTSVTQSSP